MTADCQLSLELPEILTEETESISKEYLNIFRNFLNSNTKKDVKDLKILRYLIDMHLEDKQYTLHIFIDEDKQRIRFMITDSLEFNSIIRKNKLWHRSRLSSNSRQLLEKEIDIIVDDILEYPDLISLTEVHDSKGRSYNYKGEFDDLVHITCMNE